MIGSILSGVSWDSLQGAGNDDWVDRLNHVWTVLMLVLFSVIVSTAQFVGDPISCYCGDKFTGAEVDYIKSYCWVKNTYYYHEDADLSTAIDVRGEEEIEYYQWVPIILLFQAFLFKAPNIIWRMLHGGSGVNLDKIVDMAEKTQLGSLDDREQTIDHIACYMDRWLTCRREESSWKQRCAVRCCLIPNKWAGTYIRSVYILAKVIYAANTIVQFWLLNSFLSTDYFFYGFEVLRDLTSGDTWAPSRHFPRSVLCDFKVRQIVNVQPFTVQCVLPINLFNEKIFIVLWFWLVVVAVASFLNLASWVYFVVVKGNWKRLIAKYLPVTAGERDVKAFTNHYLRSDGVFIIRIIAKNSTDLVAIDLIKKLWTSHWRSWRKQQEAARDDGRSKVKGQQQVVDMDHLGQGHVNYGFDAGTVESRKRLFDDSHI